MAAGLSRARRPARRAAGWPAAALAVLLLVAACGPPGGGSPAPRTPAGTADELATPMASLTPVVAGTFGALRNVLAPAGYRVDVLARPYRPAEPLELSRVPRAVLQVDVADPDGGFVVIYEFADSAMARQQGETFARYLGSGFGQTNFPLDAQFAVQQVGPTIVFSWWSRELSAEPERAQGAFDLISAFGQPIEVRK